MRSQQCSEWLSQITLATVCGGIKGRDTLDILADVALTWHESLQADQHDPASQFAHLTLDASRCFDTLSYEALIEIARLDGVPSEICVPFLAYLHGHKRQMVTKGWLGPIISPTCGRPQGDSLSVFMCVLWGIAACKSIEEVTSGRVQVAVYMDRHPIAEPWPQPLHPVLIPVTAGVQAEVCLYSAPVDLALVQRLCTKVPI
eukprot:1897372-Amphidinium_carterae.3